jgi:hypothetical protein
MKPLFRMLGAALVAAALAAPSYAAKDVVFAVASTMPASCRTRSSRR